MAMVDVVSTCGSSRSVWSKGWQPPGAALHSLHELGNSRNDNDSTTNIILGVVAVMH